MTSDDDMDHVPSVSKSIDLHSPAAVTLRATEVLPDRCTSAVELTTLTGRETDPGSMAIFLCLLDERPHLHPSLIALHKHRLQAHDIPLPLDPANDFPSSLGGNEEWLTWKFSEEEEARRKAYLPLA